MKLLSILKTTLLNEVSDKVKNQLVTKWSGTTDDTIETIISNIDSFESIKSGVPADKRDLMRISYEELKDLLRTKSSSKLMKTIFDGFKEREKKLENAALKKYIKRFLEIESLLPQSKKDINQYKFLELVSIINDLYPKLIIKKLTDKFGKENPNLTKDQLLFYMNSYLENLDEIPLDTKRVDEMSFSEFEHMLDGLSSKLNKKESSKSDLSDIDLVYNQNNLKIFAPKTKDQCIRLKNGRSWCTSREGTGNMYYNYRLGNERTLYYVIDEDLPYDDMNFATVILVDPNGRKSMADKSNTNRYGGGINLPWSEISAKVPKLKDLEYLFEAKPLTREERELISKVSHRNVGDNPMDTFDSEQEVEMWLEYKSPRLNDTQFMNLTTNLKKKYIALGMDLTGYMIENSEPEVVKYYLTKKMESLKSESLKDLDSSEIALLNLPMLKKLKQELKPKFVRELSTGGGNKIEIEYPNGPSAKFTALYGFDDLFESLPDTITNFLFNNKSKDSVRLSVPRSIGRFRNLEALLLMNCVTELPEEIGLLDNLTFLALPNNPSLKKLPNSIIKLNNVRFINLQGTNPEFPPGFENYFREESKGTGFYSRISAG